jgi:hypothetical protein
MKKPLLLILSGIWLLLPSVILAWNSDLNLKQLWNNLENQTSKIMKQRFDDQPNKEITKSEIKKGDWLIIKEITITTGEFKSLKKTKLQDMVSRRWYNWKTDRKILAKIIWIKNYVGTVKQNSQIKNYLLSKVKFENKTDTTTQTITKTHKQSKEMEKLPIFLFVRSRWYVWEVDKSKLAQEAGITTKYVGTRDQNLLIKKYLRSKILIK